MSQKGGLWQLALIPLLAPVRQVLRKSGLKETLKEESSLLFDEREIFFFPQEFVNHCIPIAVATGIICFLDRGTPRW